MLVGSRAQALRLHHKAGLVVTIALEAVKIVGFGRLPRLQWIALPPLTVWPAPHRSSAA